MVVHAFNPSTWQAEAPHVCTTTARPFYFLLFADFGSSGIELSEFLPLPTVCWDFRWLSLSYLVFTRALETQSPLLAL